MDLAAVLYRIDYLHLGHQDWGSVFKLELWILGHNPTQSSRLSFAKDAREALVSRREWWLLPLSGRNDDLGIWDGRGMGLIS